MGNKKRDYYDILNISKTSDKQEIKKAFRKLAMKYHPDRNKAADAEDKFKEINEAYEILSDDQKRATYDQYGHNAFANGGQQNGFSGFSSSDFGGFADIFGDFFGGAFGGRGKSSRKNSVTKGDNYQTTVVIDFLSSIKGDVITRTLPKYKQCEDCNATGAASASDIIICSQCNGHGAINQTVNTPFGQMNSQATCNICNGIGKQIKEKCHSCKGEKIVVKKTEIDIKIPAGINDEQSIVVAGFGGPGSNGGPSGDLYLNIKVRNHKYFIRRNDEIYLDVPVSIIDIIKENKIDIPTPFGIEKIKVSSKISSGEKMIISGKGAPSVRTGRKGDLILTINIYCPKLNSKEINNLSKILAKVKDKKYSNWLKSFD